ncbi:hypothetical protein FVEN_g6607 [Fusarium venenatum]|uniref:Mid2 domain-containing protein n=1 Tax=Fusarium venenatum TaxID=56646 RepID=A0A2L2SVD9_9HYPO|nr:uncharacterized protein FVRRES_04914 [Fusarium venenatum]KAG8355579.1 hypothetical protein FVEN_g6607 [Fusarium venenatum]KAH6992044.1 hypothetical protein EDB82DRAFT_553959 [Fusarium venenatum]CEI60478.1 unnamed protein product [Fusarium venenatum]
MFGRVFLLVAMATLSSARYCIIGGKAVAGNCPYIQGEDLQDEEHYYPKPVKDDSRIDRALTVPHVPAQGEAPIIIDPTRDEGRTFSWPNPLLTEVPEWSTRLRQPATSTEKTDEPVLPHKQTHTVRVSTTVFITKPTSPPLVWWTLPNPEEDQSTIPGKTTSAAFSEPTVTSSTVPKITAVPGPIATLEPTATPTPKKKSKDTTDFIIGGIIGGIIFLGLLIVVSWLSYRHYKRKHAKKPRPTIVHPFRKHLPPAPPPASPSTPEPQTPDRQRRSYWLPDTPSGGQSLYSREWGETMRMWMRAPGRNPEVHAMDKISRPKNMYTSRPATNSPRSANAKTRPAANPYLSPQPYSAPRPVDNSLNRFSIPRRPVGATYSPAIMTPLPNSPNLAPNTPQPGPSQYSESVYSQPGLGVRPDSARPIGWL